jgi:3-oxoacyl-[acyl-carrier-protein] synthase II
VFWQNLLAGRSGIGPVTLFDASAFPVRIAGEVRGLNQDDITRIFPEIQSEQDRKIWLGAYAAHQAIQHAKLNEPDLEEASIHVGVSLETICFERVLPLIDTAPASGPSFLPATISRHTPLLQISLDRTAALLGEHYNISRGQYTNCSACAAGAQAIGEAFRLVREGEVEVAIAGAADSVLTPLGLGGFCLLRILSEENDNPTHACRPFELTRQGTVLAEGAAFLVLESLEHATQRKARIHAELLGYGTSLDAFRVSDPEPEGRGAIMSMTNALSDAELSPQAVGCVNAHGTGTTKNDLMETRAIKAVLGERSRHVPVCAIKSMTGHMIASSGAAEAAASVWTLATGKIPPTINLQQPDPACDLDHVAGKPRDLRSGAVLSNSFGFGGQNASLLFGPWPRLDQRGDL